MRRIPSFRVENLHRKYKFCTRGGGADRPKPEHLARGKPSHAQESHLVPTGEGRSEGQGSLRKGLELKGGWEGSGVMFRGMRRGGVQKVVVVYAVEE